MSKAVRNWLACGVLSKYDGVFAAALYSHKVVLFLTVVSLQFLDDNIPHVGFLMAYAPSSFPKVDLRAGVILVSADGAIPRVGLVFFSTDGVDSVVMRAITVLFTYDNISSVGSYMSNTPKDFPITILHVVRMMSSATNIPRISCVLALSGSGALSGVLWEVIVLRAKSNVPYIGSLLTNAASGAAKAELLGVVDFTASSNTLLVDSLLKNLASGVT